MKKINHELVEVFWSKNILGTDDTKVALSPKLSSYKAILHYDDAGNANVSVVHKSTSKCVFDMSLDNGEVNIMELE